MKKVRLGDLATVITKGTTPTTLGYNFVDDGVNFVKIESITENGEFLTDKFAHITDECDRKLSRSQLQRNDLLFSIAGAIGRTAIVTEEILPANTNQALAIIRVPEGQVDYSYLKYVLQSPDIVEQFEKKKQGVAQLNISLKDIGDFVIPLCTEEEQKTVVSTLDKVSELIALRKEQLAKLDRLVKSRFIELFGDPKHSDKYGTRKLSSCVANKADMVDGPFGSQVNTKVDYIENGEIPVIRTVNVKMMQFSADDLKFMSREKYETVIRSQVLPGDVVLTKVGTIGNVCIFPDEYQEAVLSTTGSCRIRVDESVVNKVFFAYNLMYLKDKLLEIASTGVQPFLNMNHIKNIDVLDVPLEQQALFAAFVEQTNKSKLEIQQSLDKLELLKKSLMQEYFG